MSDFPVPLVTIGVCTYKRPDGIVKCLNSLIEQKASFPFDIVVTENDAAQGSKEIIESVIAQAAEKGIEIRYYCEPEANISIARNRCVAECRGEFFAFIDDDEWAEPDWVEQLVQVQRNYNADIVYGTVIPFYPEGFPEYLKGINDFQGMFTEGQKLESASTGSTLYKSSLFLLRDKPFDISYGKTGGEDSDWAFFLFQNHHISIIKTFKANAYEFNPISRSKMRYYWTRSFRESMIAARLFNQYYHRIMGGRVNAYQSSIAFVALLKHLLLLPIQPRKSFVIIGMDIGMILGRVLFYLGFGNFKYN